MNTIGLLLRRLTEALDGDVDAVYRACETPFSPRYFPVFRALLQQDGQSLKDLARATGLSHSAISQTSAQMCKAGLIELMRGRDGRERLATITPFGRSQLAILEPIWSAIGRAAAELDADLGFELGPLLEQVLGVLAQRRYRDRVLAHMSQAAA